VSRGAVSGAWSLRRRRASRNPRRASRRRVARRGQRGVVTPPSAGVAQPGSRKPTPPAEVAKLEEEEKTLGAKIDQLMAEWEALEAEIAAG
jgi:hypothetical protein